MGGWDDRNGDESGEPEPSANLPVPWEQDNYGGAPDDAPTRLRRDAFTPARRAAFLKHLAKYGCLTDAAKRTGVSVRTICHHQDKDAAFVRDCALATRMAGSRLELTAFERAVDGVPQLFACGGEVHTRVRHSDSLLRLLPQGTNPRKYGANPGFTRKRLRAWERKEIERDMLARQTAARPSDEERVATLVKRIKAISEHDAREKMAAGWTRTEDGGLIPPGWIRAEQADPETGRQR